jgi:hypothetical protein
MGKILDPSKNWDFAELITHDSQCSIKQTKDCGEIVDGLSGTGRFKRPFHQGDQVKMFEGQSPSSLETCEIDETGKIIIDTRSGCQYVIEVVDLDKTSWLTSLLYVRRGYLNFDEVIPDGFFDGGRDLKIERTDDVFRLRPKREVIIYDSETDVNLKKQIEEAKSMLNDVDDLRQKIRTLALYVSNSCGGTSYNRECGVGGIDDLSDKDVLCSHYLVRDGGYYAVLLGDLNHGVCAHRAGKFKYLSSRVRVPSRLVRGLFGDNQLNDVRKICDESGRQVEQRSPHAWNSVKIEGKYYLLDIAKDPLTLKEETPKSKTDYHRILPVSHDYGGLGFKSVDQQPFRFTADDILRQR